MVDALALRNTARNHFDLGFALGVHASRIVDIRKLLAYEPVYAMEHSQGS
jgi:hypothetical protein